MVSNSVWAGMIGNGTSVFLNEVGADKTFMTGVASAAKIGFWPTFISSSVALVLSAAVAAGAGSMLSTVFNPKFAQILSGSILIVMGFWTLWGAFHSR